MKKELDSIDCDKYHPVKSAHYLAGLLIDLKHQANLGRISMLLEFVVANFNGQETPSPSEFGVWLNEYEPLKEYKSHEDPCEDVYVSRCVTRWGDYRIFNGKWNSNEHYLGIMLDAISDLPPEMDLQVTPAIKALLKLSELVAERCNAQLYEIPEQQFTIELDEGHNLSRHLVFSREDLLLYDLRVNDFLPFIFDLKDRSKLNQQHEGSTDMERHPLILSDEQLLVIRPTEIALAIKRYIIEWCSANRLTVSLEKKIFKVHLDRLSNGNFIDGLILKDAPLIPQYLTGGCLTEVSMTWGKGRFIHVVILIDALFEFDQTGFCTSHSKQKDLSKEVGARVRRFQEKAKEMKGFKEGVVLCFLCGYGRVFKFTVEWDDAPGWTSVNLTSYDVATMQYLKEFPTKSFWRLVSQLRSLENDEFRVINLSGFLNIYGWWRECGEMLLPKEFGPSQYIGIPTDCIAEVRKASLISAGIRSLKYVDGTLKRVVKMNNEDASDLENKPVLYISTRELEDRACLGCVLIMNKGWWVCLEDFKDIKITKDIAFRLWDMTIKWVERIAPVLVQELASDQNNTIQFLLNIRQVLFDESIAASGVYTRSYEPIVDFEVDRDNSTVRIILLSEFMNAVYSPINIAERSVVRACIKGYADLTGVAISEIEVERICDRIIVNTGARHFHVFASNSFTTTLFIRQRNCTTIEEVDWGFVKLGLGNSKRESGKRRITGKDNCTAFLAAAVEKLYSQLAEALAKFNREQIIHTAFENICGIEFDRGTWKRTARAMISLGVDLDEYVEERSKRFEKITVADIASRIIIEVAVCVSDPTEGLEADRNDLSQLMAIAATIFLLGNRSDGIGKGIDQPQVEVAGNGEILLSRDFLLNIVAPILTGNEKDISIQDSESYEDLFEQVGHADSSATGFDPEFVDAFHDEFGVSIESMFEFAKGLDKKMAMSNQDIMVMKRSEVKSFFSEINTLNDAILDRILEQFSLAPRINYSVPPDGYNQRDIKPWLFRRRISLLFRPMVKLNSIADESFIIVPDYFFKAFTYIITTYQNSLMDPDRCQSGKMKKWIGNQARISGQQFNYDLAAELKTLGYETMVDTNVSSLIHPTALSGKNYGDVDVIAWKKGSKAMFLIECKDLFYAKTFSEMADQMLDYRGELRNSKPDKLKKHIERLRIIAGNKHRIEKTFEGLLPDFSIHGYVVFSKRVPILYDKTYKGPVKFSFLGEVKDRGLDESSPF